MDVQMILEKLQEFGFIRLGRITGHYHQVHCPFHNDGKERRPSCGVLLEDEYRNGKKYPKGLWHCFACQTAKSMEDAVAFLLKGRHIDTDAIEWMKANIPGFEAEVDSDLEALVPKNLMEEMTNQFALDYIQQQLNQKAPTFVSEEELASYRYTVPYMEERGLTPELIEMFDVGVDLNFIPPGRKKKVPCLTFPVRDIQGRTLFFCRRSIEGKLFNYPDGVVKPVYGIDLVPRGCSSVIITESCINTITCRKFGYIAVGTLGTGNPYQIQQLKELGAREYILCFDGDDAGKIATKKFKRELSSCALIWTITMPPGKDVNDCTKEEFDQLYENRE